MKAKTSETIALSLLAAVEGAHFFSARLPSKMTVIKFVTDEEAAQAIKAGMIEAVCLSMGLNLIVAWLSKSWLPVFIGSAATAVMAWLTWRDLTSAQRKGG